MADWNIPINSLICLNGEPKCEVNRIGLLSTSQNPPLHIKFSIRFQARVTAAEADANSASASAGSLRISRTFSEPLSALLPAAEHFCGAAELADAEGRARLRVADMLSAVRVPPLGPVVDKVLDGTRRMARGAGDLTSACTVVMEMSVDIALSVTHPRIDSDSVCDSDGDDDGDSVVGFGPASEEAIEGLERLRISGEASEKSSCAVCLEDIPAGSEASRLPCSHLFLGDCIALWLCHSKFCPLCRFELPGVRKFVFPSTCVQYIYVIILVCYLIDCSGLLY